MTHRIITSEEYLAFVHDIRSPLTAIRNWAELMIRNPEADYLKQLLRNVDRAEKLVSSILDIGTQSGVSLINLKDLVIKGDIMSTGDTSERCPAKVSCPAPDHNGGNLTCYGGTNCAAGYTYASGACSK